MRVVVNGNYTYQTDLDVKVGDTVLLRTPDWLQDVKGPTWEGVVTALGSDYQGYCASILKIVKI